MKPPRKAGRLRIAYLSAGTFSHATGYVEYFESRGHEVYWIVYTRPAPALPAHPYDVSVEVDPQGSRLCKWRYLCTLPRIRALLRRLRPDILHAHYATSAGLLALTSGFRPYVLSARGTDLLGSRHSPFWRGLLRAVLSRAALVHTVSDELTAVARSLGVPRRKLVTLTQGIDLRMLPFAPAAPAGPVRLLCTRHLREPYDPQTILRACRILKARGIDFRLTFAGSGQLRAALQDEARAYGIEPQTRFLGGYEPAAVPTLFAEADLYVSASRWDGTSISLLEAMACGAFPIVSRIPSNLAWVTDGQTALMFDPGDAEGLARAVERAIRSPELRRSAVRANRLTVETRADRTRNMARLESLYYAVVQSSRGPAAAAGCYGGQAHTSASS